MLSYLIGANHGNPLEHVTFQFQIEGVSRAFLAQITRHRMGSFTTSSQHYQDYRDYPLVMSSELQHVLANIASTELDKIYELYARLVDEFHIKPEEARQILPNAAAVNIIWSVNARSLQNFLNLRMCNRNVMEMRIFAYKIYKLVQLYWPDYTDCLGADCVVSDCRQGKMMCEQQMYEVPYV